MLQIKAVQKPEKLLLVEFDNRQLFALPIFCGTKMDRPLEALLLQPLVPHMEMQPRPLQNNS